MSALESRQELAWQDPQLAGHNILHAALSQSAGTESGDSYNAGATENEHMTLMQAAAFLGISIEEVHELIKRELLCASPKGRTGDYLIDRECAKAQRSAYMNANRDSKNVAGLDDLFSLDALAENQNTFNRSQTSDPLTGEEPSANKALTQEEREVITTKNVDALLSSLDFANVRLETAMYRAGYLEAQVESLQVQLKILPDLRLRSAQAILVERENALLADKLSAHEIELAAKQAEIGVLQIETEAKQTEIDALQTRLTKLQESKIYKFCKWAFGLQV